MSATITALKGSLPTFCSMPFDAVWASTTRWANLMQLSLTGAGATSQMRNILDLMADICSQLSVW
jgi:hypothetical protein